MSSTTLTDTHCHLYLDEFSNDLGEIMLRAEKEGVTKFYLPALDSHHHASMFKLEKNYPGRCLSMIGVHPCYVRENYADELAIIGQYLEKRPFSAVGEIGLDYYWSREFDECQMISFVEQIKLAKKYDLPIVIHSRNSMDDCIAVLKKEKDEKLKGIFHCFSGNLQNAIDIIESGLLLGIGGVVTYKNAGLAEVVAELPLKKIVLETDAPYLTPVPFRGKRNEPAYLKYIADKIAQLKGVSVEEVARITTENAVSVFGG